MNHQLHHALVAVGVFKAGEATTVRARAGWLLVAACGFVLCHSHHHQRSHQ